MKCKAQYKITMIIGALLLVFAAGLLLFTLHSERSSEKMSDDLLYKFDEIVSGADEPLGSYYGEMPALNIDGKDIIGKLTFPTCGLSAPVLYEKNGSVLCRVSGSLYDSDLVLQGSSKQLVEAAESLMDNDYVEFTDTQGNTFLLKADTIKHTRDAQSVVREGAALTIIVNNELDMSCIVISCLG